ncbi:MAG: hypothetical protein AAF998_06925 [Bacteroidota bacterium]
MLVIEIVVLIAFSLLAGEMLAGLALIPSIPVILIALFRAGKVAEKKQVGSVVGKIIRLVGLSMVVALVVFLILFWYFDWGNWSLKFLFQNPIIVFSLLVLIIMISNLFKNEERNIGLAIFNEISGAWKWRAGIALLVIILYSYFFPNRSDVWIFEWGITVGVVFAIMSLIVMVGNDYSILSKLEEYEEGAERLEERVANIETIAKIIAFANGDFAWKEEASRIRSILDEGDERAGENNARAAKAKLLEAQVSSDTFQSRITFLQNEEFQDDLFSRLESLIEEISRLAEEYSFREQLEENLSRIRGTIEKWREEYAETIQWWHLGLTDLQSLKDAIEELQRYYSALSLFENVGDRMESQRSSAHQIYFSLYIFQTLGEDVSQLSKCLIDWETQVEEFRNARNLDLLAISSEIMRLEELHKGLVAENARIAANVNEKWINSSLGKDVLVFIPKHLQLDQTALAYAVVNRVGLPNEVVRISMGAINVLLGDNPEYVLEPISIGDYQFETMKIRGGSAGKDLVKVTIGIEGKEEKSSEIPVRTIPAPKDLIDLTSALTVILSGGPAALILGATGMPIETAATWATAIGGVFASLAFGLRYYLKIFSKRNLVTTK